MEMQTRVKEIVWIAVRDTNSQSGSVPSAFKFLTMTSVEHLREESMYD